MGYLQTGIEMRDQFNVVLMSFVNSMTAAVTAANDFSDVMNQNINTNPLDHVRGEIQSVTEELDALNQSASTPLSPDVSADQSVRRLNERIEQTGDLLDRVSGIQQSISAGSERVEVLPEETQENIQRANERLLEMRAEMDQISQNPFDMPTDEVEAQLVSLQERIRETLQEQLALNEELSHMDMENEQPPPMLVPDTTVFYRPTIPYDGTVPSGNTGGQYDAGTIGAHAAGDCATGFLHEHPASGSDPGHERPYGTDRSCEAAHPADREPSAAFCFEQDERGTAAAAGTPESGTGVTGGNEPGHAADGCARGQ